MKSAFNISLKSIKMAGIEFMGNVEVSVSQSDDQYHTELNLAVNKVKTEDIDLDMDLQLSISSDFSEKEYVESFESALEDLMSDDKIMSVKKLEDKYSIELPYMKQVTEDITPVAQKLVEKLSPLFDMISELDSSEEPIDIELGDDPTDEPIDLELRGDDTETPDTPEVIKVTVSPDSEHETVHEVSSDSDPIDDIHYWYRYILKNKNDVDEIRIEWMDGSQITLIKSKYMYSKYGRKSTRRVGDVFYYYKVDANYGKLGDMKVGVFTEL